MRLLILSCNTGQGHNSCARAVREHFELRGDTCEIADALGFISGKASRFISSWHTRLYRYAPNVLDKGYKYAERHAGVMSEDSVIYKLLTAGTEALYEFIQNGSYNAVLCVHVFAALLLSRTLTRYSLRLTTGLLATDYTCSPGFGGSKLDYCFIPDMSLLQAFVDAGLPKERVVVTGIPVCRAFRESVSRRLAKQNCGIGLKHSHILMMCGSMGCGPIGQIAAFLGEEMDEETELSIICGTNQRLQAGLQNTLRKHSNIHIHGYVNNIPLLMDSADLFLTKPGGISVSEAAVKRLPMVFIDAVAGCESGNLQFFVGRGTAQTAQTPKEISALCVRLVQDKAQLIQMATAFGTIPSYQATELIYQYLTQ